MKTGKGIGFFIVLFAVLIMSTVSTHAELILRGTDSLGYRLIYDTDLNITWYDNTKSGDLWQNQLNWAAELTVSFNGTIYDDWRLPSTVDGPYVWGYNGSTTAGWNITTSEMGHLFYTELGNKGRFSITGQDPQPGWGLTNTGYFQTLQQGGIYPGFYWSGTEFSQIPDNAWAFSFSNGDQTDRSKTNGLWSSYYALAVRDGDVLPIDSDGDGVPDSEDICPGGDDNIDTDGDIVPNFCDPCPNDAQNDADGDGVCGDLDVCDGGDDNLNTDSDSLPNFCDACPIDPENDADGDGICESEDNCPLIANNQFDNDGDGEGDECDSDDDNDGSLDADDNCPYDYNPDQANHDSDSEGDVCDKDDDNDHILDASDQCLFTNTGEVVNQTGCSIADLTPCYNPWKNHGAYVSSVAKTANSFLEQGLITQAEKDAIVSSSADSTCGQK